MKTVYAVHEQHIEEQSFENTTYFNHLTEAYLHYVKLYSDANFKRYSIYLLMLERKISADMLNIDDSADMLNLSDNEKHTYQDNDITLEQREVNNNRNIVIRDTIAERAIKAYEQTT